MGRPSKLTPAQKDEVARRLAAGEGGITSGSGLDSFIAKRITKLDATAAASEDGGMALSILTADASGCDATILSWAHGVTRAIGFQYVYVFKGTHRGVERYKIGKAKSIKDRRSIFAVKLPFDIDLVAAFRVKDAMHTEAAIHRAQAVNRVGGEWFDLDSAAFDAVCRQGLSVELHDLADAIDAHACAPSRQDLMSDGEYIAHLECLLAMQGVEFSRVKPSAGAGNGP